MLCTPRTIHPPPKQTQDLVSMSILVRNISSSLRQLALLYGEKSSDGARSSLTATPHTIFTEPANNEAAAALYQFLCEEFNMDDALLRKWRAHQLNCGTIASLATQSNARNNATGSNASQADAIDCYLARWIEQGNDQRLIKSAITDMYAVMSPFLRLVETDKRIGTEFIAARDIDAGMFLFSIPTMMTISSNPPSTGGRDAIVDHFLHVDDLCGKLVAAADDPTASHHCYVQYLRESVAPPPNLPFLERSELESTELIPLWEQFHQEMEKRPMSEWLDQRLTPEEYAWHVSVVMSRRSGLSMVIPLVDKLNHSHNPNAYFTMATHSSFCGLDILDNLMAGVEDISLLQPYVHVFAIQPIPKGNPVTISYSEASIRSAEGRDLWKCGWGFVPQSEQQLKESELKEIANIVAARRVDLRTAQFPRKLAAGAPVNAPKVKALS